MGLFRDMKIVDLSKEIYKGFELNWLVWLSGQGLELSTNIQGRI